MRGKGITEVVREIPELIELYHEMIILLTIKTSKTKKHSIACGINIIFRRIS